MFPVPELFLGVTVIDCILEDLDIPISEPYFQKSLVDLVHTILGHFDFWLTFRMFSSFLKISHAPKMKPQTDIMGPRGKNVQHAK